MYSANIYGLGDSEKVGTLLEHRKIKIRCRLILFSL
jgi:hypothetical protein